MTMNKTVIDPETGEAYELVALEGEKRKRGGPRQAKSEGFTQLWLGDLLEVLNSGPPSVACVFLTLAQEMDPITGLVRYRPDDLAAHLDYRHGSTASAAVGVLVRLGLIRRPRRGEILVNPNHAWRGSAQNRTAAIWRWGHEG